MRQSILLAMALWPCAAYGDEVTNSVDGINSTVTGLTGSGVSIGMAELGRSGKAGYDSAANSASNTIPVGVYFQNSGGMDSANSGNIDPHATAVAAVAAAKSAPYPSYVGVAPESALHSIAVADHENDDLNALALNRLTFPASGAAKAVNISYYRPLQFFENPDGRSHFAQFIDWAARRYDVLYTVGWGNVDSDLDRTPGDNYNGMTVAASEFVGEETVFRKFSFVNATEGHPGGNRSAISILAPGSAVPVIGHNEEATFESGTSFAAPHVLGASALLHQYAQQQIDASNPRFAPGANPNSRRHETLKAVMMNSADKLAGVHGSSRDVVDSNELDWLESEAYLTSSIPLDDEMGAGHLNVERAVQQLAPGEYGPGNVPMLGWDYGNIGNGGTNEYIFSGQSSANEYIAVTLAWDRIVNHTGGNFYLSGDQFFPYDDADDILNNLDLRIETSDGQTIAAESNSFEMNVEHIFFKFSGGGNYKIVVDHNGGLGTSQNYALAWWAGSGSSPSPAGDYDKNGSVGPEDYDIWKSNFGTNFADADGNGNGTVDAADYSIWRDNLGAGSGSGGLAAVPEPAAVWLMIAAVVIGGCGWRGRE